MVISTTLFLSIQNLVLLLSLNIMGSSSLPYPNPFAQHDVQHSRLLKGLHSAASEHTQADSASALPPSADDVKHLAEWLEAADYATSALVMMAGVIGLDAGAIPPPESERRALGCN
jgi:hypothetical protein